MIKKSAKEHVPYELNRGMSFKTILLIIIFFGCALMMLSITVGENPKTYTDDSIGCVFGYKFYRERQILDKDGKGVQCDNVLNSHVPPVIK